MIKLPLTHPIEAQSSSGDKLSSAQTETSEYEKQEQKQKKSRLLLISSSLSFLSIKDEG